MKPELSYGPPRDERELRALADVMTQGLASSPPQGDAWYPLWQKRWCDGTDLRVVRREGRVIASLAIIPMGQFFGGRLVPSGAISAVAVAPEERGAGVASFLMRETLRELRARGVPISALYPASQSLYRKSGYEQAGAYVTYKISTLALPDLRGDLPPIRPLTPEDRPALVALHDERARVSTGLFQRGPFLWNSILEAQNVRTFGYLVEGDGGPEGYVVFHHREAPERRYDVWVKDLLARTPRAMRRLLSFLRGHASMAAHVFFQGAPADPLLYQLAEQDDHAVAKRIVWMLRLVDIPRALALRGYPRALGADLHLDVRDDLFPEQSGRLVLSVRGGEAIVTPGGRGEILLHARALATLYTGYLGAHDLALQGAIMAPEAALDDASAVFAGPPPFLPDMV